MLQGCVGVSATCDRLTDCIATLILHPCTHGPFSVHFEGVSCVSKNRGKTPKMDGENNGSKPYEQMDDLGGKILPLFLVQHPCIVEQRLGLLVSFGAF